MKKIQKLILICLLSILVIGCGKSESGKNEKAFQKSVKDLQAETVALKELTSFEWDGVYSFRPYLSKKEISKFTGIDIEEVYDTNVDESITNLLFVKDGKVVCRINGRPENIGLSIEFGGKPSDYVYLSYNNPCNFTVKIENGICYLKQME